MNPATRSAMKKLLFSITLFAAVVTSAVAESAQPVPVELPPVEPPARKLHLSGGAGPVELGFAELEALGTHQVTTSTFWPDDDGTYSGPLLSDVLRIAGLEQSPAVRIRAMDGFSQVLPREDWTRWPVILATRRDGQVMTTRSKGPYRIIYPRDMSEELTRPVYRLRWVWLIDRIEEERPQ